ncbi:3-isopropylmalate dehydratase large subunit [bacterium]|nr:3-isopropylmalate dehydratase large subunit [bacterium]
MKRNIVDKIWDAHVVTQKEGHPAVFAIDLLLMHEVTSAQAFQELERRGLSPRHPERILATIDHSIPTRKNRLQIADDAARTQVETLRQNAAQYGLEFYDFDSGDQGIVHVVGPELGATQPGMTIVCGDSHTSTHGAFGALAFGVGTSEVGHVLATGCLLQQKPRTMRVRFSGSPPRGVYAKDIILRLIQELGIGGATGHVIEYTGEAISQMSMEERMTLCNMSIECGARAGLIAPDETTAHYIRGRRFAPQDSDWERAVAHWQSFRSDEGASFDAEVEISLESLSPMATWGTNPGQAIEIREHIPFLRQLPEEERSSAAQALQYIGLEEGTPLAKTPVDWAFIGSCTNGRIEDLRVAAEVLRGKKVNPAVTLYIVPGSERVREQAIAEGLHSIFETAGADFRLPGCSMCLSMNDDTVPSGARCISSSNRNFVGRQGAGSRTHLASPATVAASAIAGSITTAEEI